MIIIVGYVIIDMIFGNHDNKSRSWEDPTITTDGNKRIKCPSSPMIIIIDKDGNEHIGYPAE